MPKKASGGCRACGISIFLFCIFFGSIQYHLFIKNKNNSVNTIVEDYSLTKETCYDEQGEIIFQYDCFYGSVHVTNSNGVSCLINITNTLDTYNNTINYLNSDFPIGSSVRVFDSGYKYCEEDITYEMRYGATFVFIVFTVITVLSILTYEFHILIYNYFERKRETKLKTAYTSNMSVYHTMNNFV